jgi:hypothetical protein
MYICICVLREAKVAKQGEQEEQRQAYMQAMREEKDSSSGIGMLVSMSAHDMIMHYISRSFTTF